CTEPIRLVICDLSNSPTMDLAGARMVAAMHDELRTSGTALQVVGAHAEVRDILRAEGLDKLFGHLDRRTTVADAVDEFRASIAADPPLETLHAGDA
ncbi:MAG: sodium-independent anion transporter, partial [Cupriavidus sp.]|nr:sodium-independent anion transporter [Cupriavidus sp.]